MPRRRFVELGCIKPDRKDRSPDGEVWLHLIREERMKEGRKREVGLICREREG